MKKIILFIIILFIISACSFFEWNFKKQLPANASDVFEWYRDYGFLPDYTYYLKAKISYKDYIKYIKYFDLTLHTPERKYTNPEYISWTGFHEEVKSWWFPGDSLDETYVYEEGETLIYAKYKNGYLYLKSICY